MHSVYIGLGSNLNQPQAQLEQAIKTLQAHEHINGLSCSSFYRSKALTLNDEPQPDYINAVAHFKTKLEPEAVLALLHQIEQQQGRTRLIKWGARNLDLDILLFDDLQISLPDLIIPHPQMHLRNFVLLPLYEIAPNLQIPGLGALSTIIKTVSDKDLFKI